MAAHMLYEISLCRTLSLLSQAAASRRIHLHTDYGGVAHSVVVGVKGFEPRSRTPQNSQIIEPPWRNSLLC